MSSKWHFTYSIIIGLNKTECGTFFFSLFKHDFQFHVFKNHYIKCKRGYYFAKFERSHVKLDSFRQANSQC